MEKLIEGKSRFVLVILITRKLNRLVRRTKGCSKTDGMLTLRLRWRG